MKKFAILSVLILITANLFCNEYQQFKGWKQAETTHFRFIYENDSKLATEHYAQIADDAWNKIAKIYSMPQDKTDVYVFGRTNIVNAYTYFSPTEIVMFNSAPLTPYFGFRDDWMKTFFTHELIHVANVTFEDKDYFSSKLFGPLMKSMDYSMLDGWALEGLTTVLETELTDGGRGRSPYFEIQYKATTLDNSFISYNEIGTEAEPPYSQIYVIGYLMMRSIADRWGLEALADIERNRTDGLTWEDSVRKVTGHDARDIYREVRISLEKKFAGERVIPEGKIISPNSTNTNYDIPAVILDDGTIIASRSVQNGYTSVVKLCPGNTNGTQYIEDAKKTFIIEENPSKAPKETILFTSNFSDERAVTSDKNMTIYASVAISRYHKNPGSETQFQIFKWTEEEGLKQLTHDSSSYYQPAVSYDGSVLVAVEQNGLYMRLVQIDTETGDTKVLLQEPEISFVEPAVNADGSKIAFLVLQKDRACVAISETDSGVYELVNNTNPDKNTIVDPSYPNFTSDGKLIYVSNDRGRLELFEAAKEGNSYSSKAMLSDPIGMLWGYKNDMGVFYQSFSSTGYVIKIKPASEWGTAADFEGPTPPGQIMHFGDLQDDYPDFNPYKSVAVKSVDQKSTEIDQEVEVFAQETMVVAKEEVVVEQETVVVEPVETTNTSDNSDAPYKKRSEEKLLELETLPEATLELTNERKFISGVTSLFYLPFFSIVETPNGKNHFGLGGLYYGSTSRLQMRQGLIIFDGFYYPSLNNFSADLVAEIPLGTTTIDTLIGRNFSTSGKKKSKKFEETNIGVIGWTIPLNSQEQFMNYDELSLSTMCYGTIVRKDKNEFKINQKVDTKYNLSFQLGFNYYENELLEKLDTTSFEADLFAIGTYDFDYKKVFAGFEGENAFKTTINNSSVETRINYRYTDFPSQTVPVMSRAHFSGFEENCEYPGKIVLEVNSLFPNFLGSGLDGKFFVQGMSSFGKNTVDFTTPDNKLPFNLTLDKRLNTGFELGLISVAQKIAVGFTWLTDFTDAKNPETDYKFYITCKINWIRL